MRWKQFTEMLKSHQNTIDTYGIKSRSHTKGIDLAANRSLKR